MYAAVLELGSWMGPITRYFTGDSPGDIIRQFEQVQDLGCLVDMGRMNEDKKGQKEIDKIEAFLDKYDCGKLTIEDIRDFAFKLNVCAFRCLEVAENETAAETL